MHEQGDSIDIELLKLLYLNEALTVPTHTIIVLLATLRRFRAIDASTASQ